MVGRVKSYLRAGAELKVISDRVVLQQTPRRTIVLRDDTGALTRAGRAWEAATGRVLKDGGFLAQEPVRQGNVETIRLRDKSKAVTRRWVPSLGKWRFTAVGKRYYKTITRNYVVSVPAVKVGRRKDGSEYRVEGIHVPLSLLGFRKPSLALDVDDDSRYAKVKAIVMEQLGEGAMLSHSDETWFYDPEGDFRISEETIGVNPETK